MDTLIARGRRRGTARERHAGGFTFVEVLVAAVIVGLLAALALPSFMGTRDRATGATAESLLRVGSAAVETASVEPGGYAGLTTAELQAQEPAVSWTTSAGALARDAQITLSGLGPSGYTLATTTPAGVTYVLAKDLSAQPTVTRTCGPGCTW